MTDNQFEPQPKDLVYARDPEDTDQDAPTLVMVVRRATLQDKQDFFKKYTDEAKGIFNIETEVDKESLDAFFSQDHFFLCIDDEEFTIVSREHMVSLANRNEDEGFISKSG